MKTATFRRYADGQEERFDVALPDHATKTGTEDHFALACHDARMILIGLKLADPSASFSIHRVEI